ncbi:BA14K family protein [Hoeflea prorocentri]|uniref:Lectin-like protein BA14k n=1 Tax=Hoeflea prorocentri TaxID=1922333 RepID=A0A9X3UIV2_9HYPH|nr:BA14K family protein [Hoeflea prorocentri]MCY6379999.1 BA14K family protein [Hoeflea prorocentri]MDA5397799.1 BA14K family protein [Hoeflea prorocentri]
MSGLLKGLAIAVISAGLLAMAAPHAEAGKKYRYGHKGGNFGAGLVTGLIIGGIVASGPRHGYYYGPRHKRYYGKRYYYPKPYYGPRHYRRTYGPAPYYRPAPRPRYYGSRAHVNYCFRKYRSYRISDNTFQPYHGPRRPCRSPY